MFAAVQRARRLAYLSHKWGPPSTTHKHWAELPCGVEGLGGKCMEAVGGFWRPQRARSSLQQASEHWLRGYKRHPHQKRLLSSCLAHTRSLWLLSASQSMQSRSYIATPRSSVVMPRPLVETPRPSVAMTKSSAAHLRYPFNVAYPPAKYQQLPSKVAATPF